MRVATTVCGAVGVTLICVAAVDVARGANCVDGCKVVACWKNLDFTCHLYSPPKCNLTIKVLPPTAGDCVDGNGTVILYDCECDPVCDNDAALAGGSRERQGCTMCGNPGSVALYRCTGGGGH
jgi:hypothetical protein